MADTKRPPIMEKDQNNLNSETNPQIPPEEFTPESNEASYKEDSLETAQEIEPEKENFINEDPSVGEKSYSGKGWLFLLIILITLSLGIYFYFQKNGIDIVKNLPWDFKKPSLAIPKKSNSLDTQPKKLPVEPIEKIVAQTETVHSPEKIIFENKKMIHLLRKEIQSLKSELEQKNTSALPRNIKSQIQQLNSSALDKKIKAIKQTGEEEPKLELENPLAPSLPIKIEPMDISEPIDRKAKNIKQTEEEEPRSELENLLAYPSPVKTEQLIQQKKINKTPPQRSEEVQAYLDFVENNTTKLIELVKKGLAHLKKFIL